jgi:hypothetical protein
LSGSDSPLKVVITQDENEEVVELDWRGRGNVPIPDMNSLITELSDEDISSEARRVALNLIKDISNAYLEKINEIASKSENVRQEIWDTVSLVHHQEVNLLALISRVSQEELDKYS